MDEPYPGEVWAPKFVGRHTKVLKIVVRGEHLLQLNGEHTDLPHLTDELKKVRGSDCVMWCCFKASPAESDFVKGVFDAIMFEAHIGTQIRVGDDPDFKDLIEEQRQMRSLILKLHKEHKPDDEERK